MPLESLLQLVETLRERINSYDYDLRRNETRTRYALIDPLLRGLGWDTSDPGMVKIEYNSGAGRVDYALFDGGRLRMMVEAKALGNSLGDSVLFQGIRYSRKKGASHFSITNGVQWKIYGTYSRDLIGEFNLKTGSWAAEACLKAVPLWRPGGWHRLTDIENAKGLKPAGLLSLDIDMAELKSWRDLPVEVIRWLMANSLLTPSDCPIRAKSTRSERYLVNTRPYHRSRRKFSSPSEEVNGLFVELDYDADSHASNTRTIIDYAGLDPSEFKVRFS